MHNEYMTALACRYEFDKAEQLMLVVDQLEVSADMLLSDTVSTSRAAIILLDHLAEILLRRRCEALFRAGEGQGPFKSRTYTASERKEIRGHCGQAVGGGRRWPPRR